MPKNKTRLTIEIDPEIKRRFKAQAYKDGHTEKSKLIEWIDKYIDNTPSQLNIYT